MKVGFRPKRKSLFKVVYIQNGIITGGFYEPVPSLLFRPVTKVARVFNSLYAGNWGGLGGYRFNLCGLKYCLV